MSFHCFLDLEQVILIGFGREGAGWKHRGLWDRRVSYPWGVVFWWEFELAKYVADSINCKEAFPMLN